MKMFSVILVTSLILALTMVFSINTSAQDANPQIYMDSTDQDWPLISGIIIAYHDLPTEHHHWENLDIHEIADFVDKSIREKILLGYESDAIFGPDPYRGARLKILKDKIDEAEYAIENKSFQEACRHLLDAYSGTDGFSETPDLVYGPAAPELATMIEYMRIEIIGCD